MEKQAVVKTREHILPKSEKNKSQTQKRMENLDAEVQKP